MDPVPDLDYIRTLRKRPVKMNILEEIEVSKKPECMDMLNDVTPDTNNPNFRLLPSINSVNPLSGYFPYQLTFPQ